MNKFYNRLISLSFNNEKNYQFAERIGIPATQLSRYKSGSMPKDGTIHKFATRTGVAFEWLKTGEGDKHPAPSNVISKEVGQVEDDSRAVLIKDDGGPVSGPLGPAPERAELKRIGFLEERAEVIAGQLLETGLSEYEAGVLGDLIRIALTDPRLRAKIIEHFTLLRQLEEIDKL